MKRDDEPSRELVKTFATSRGELTIQPERSGHYTFTFLQLSDANYKKVALKGPSIDQVVHPPASADFAHHASAGGRSKRKINSCSGNTVDVNVDLRGTGPWNLDVQVVGPKGSEVVRVEKITTPRKKIQVPIPAAIDRDGGTFEIDLGKSCILTSFSYYAYYAPCSERRRCLWLQAFVVCPRDHCERSQSEGKYSILSDVYLY